MFGRKNLLDEIDCLHTQIDALMREIDRLRKENIELLDVANAEKKLKPKRAQKAPAKKPTTTKRRTTTAKK